MHKCHLAMFITLTLGVCVQRITMAGSSILLGICIALYLYCAFKEREKVAANLLRKEVLWFLCAHLVLVVLLLPSLFAPGNFAREIREFFNLSLYHLVPFLVLVSFVEQRKHLLLMLGAFLLVEGVESGVAIWQTAVDYSGPGSRGNGFHATGLFMPGMLAYVLPLCGFILLDEHFEKKLKILAAMVFPLLVGAVFAAISRAGFLIFLAMIGIVGGYYVVKNKQLKVLALVFVLLIGAGAFFSGALKARLRTAADFSGQDLSNYARVLLWQSSLQMMEDYPLTGVGLSNWGKFYKKHYIPREIIKIGQGSLAHAHSNYMQIGGSAGWPGLAGIVFFHLGVLGVTLWNWLRYRDVYSGILFTMWLGEGVFGLIEPVFVQSDQCKNIMLLTGIVVGMKMLAADEVGEIV